MYLALTIEEWQKFIRVSQVFAVSVNLADFRQEYLNPIANYTSSEFRKSTAQTFDSTVVRGGTDVNKGHYLRNSEALTFGARTCVRAGGVVTFHFQSEYLQSILQSLEQMACDTADISWFPKEEFANFRPSTYFFQTPFRRRLSNIREEANLQTGFLQIHRLTFSHLPIEIRLCALKRKFFFYFFSFSFSSLFTQVINRSFHLSVLQIISLKWIGHRTSFHTIKITARRLRAAVLCHRRFISVSSASLLSLMSIWWVLVAFIGSCSWSVAENQPQRVGWPQIFFSIRSLNSQRGRQVNEEE